MAAEDWINDCWHPEDEDEDEDVPCKFCGTLIFWDAGHPYELRTGAPHSCVAYRQSRRKNPQAVFDVIPEDCPKQEPPSKPQQATPIYDDTVRLDWLIVKIANGLEDDQNATEDLATIRDAFRRGWDFRNVLDRIMTDQS